MVEQNRRRSERKPLEGESAGGTIVIGFRRYAVLVLDESVHGLGLIATHNPPVEVGMKIKFESIVRKIPGRVASIKHIRTLQGPVSRIGLEWVDEA